MKTYSCLSCGKENNWSHQKTNKYCNNQCQKDYEYKQYITEWKDGIQTGVNSYGTSNHLHRYVLEKQNGKCSECGIDSWMEKSLKLELDHKDGNHTNNKEENLRCLCPNCHSQTSTYKNRNVGNGRTYRKKVL